MDKHEKHPWEIFFDEFRGRAKHIPLRYRDWSQESEDLLALKRVIVQARQATFEHLRLDRHWDVEEAQALTDRFTVFILIPWLRDGSGNWQVLRDELHDEWTFPSSGHEPSGGEASLGY